MAKYASEGAGVTLVTCTLGEEGEVIVPELGHLASGRDDTLGQFRIAELASACAELGVGDHRFLGGPGRWRDSGMMGSPENAVPGCFWRADFAEVTAALVAVVREVQPHVVITYDENGAYGHPDHIQANRVTMSAVAAAAEADYRPDLGPPWRIGKVYWTCTPRSVLAEGLEHLKAVNQTFLQVESVDEIPFATPDELVTTAIDAREFLPHKLAAMRAHASQISTDGPFFSLADGVGQWAFATEYYRRVAAVGAGENQDHDRGQEREDDLFAGLD